jgi:uncharacterized protein YbjQ (UPF0145 family)
MASQTKAQSANIASSFRGISQSFSAIAGAAGFGGLGAALGLSVTSLVNVAKEQLTRFSQFLAGHRAATETELQRFARTDRLFAERQQNRGRFDEFRAGLRGQIENRGLSPDQVRLNEFARTFGSSRVGRGLVEEAQRDIDHIRMLGEAATAAAASLREVQQAQRDNVSAASNFADRVNALLDINRPRPGFAPGPGNVVSGEAINRGIAGLFRSLGGGEQVSLPRLLERGSVDAVSAINTAASQRGNSIADVVARLEEMVELDRQQVQEGIRLREAIEANPRLRSLLGRSGS